MILRRIEGERYSEVLPTWKGKAVAIVGAGPSLTQAQAHCLEVGCVPTIAVNNAFLWAPFAAVAYAADAKWHAWTASGYTATASGGIVPNDKPRLGLTGAQIAEKWRAFKGQKCTIEWGKDTIADEAVHVLRNRDADAHGMGLSTDPRMLATGRNSGAQAVNLAVLAGATTIFLLGFDGGPDADGKTNFHGGHPTPTNPQIWPYIRQSFSAMEDQLKALGVRVWNCSPSSAIDSFPKLTIETALETAFAA
jgi:hypothetical protein